MYELNRVIVHHSESRPEGDEMFVVYRDGERHAFFFSEYAAEQYIAASAP